MLVSLSMETVNGETGFYSSWVVWPVLSLVSMVSRNSALFTLLQGPRPAPQPRGGGTSHLQTRESPTGETLPRHPQLLRVCQASVQVTAADIKAHSGVLFSSSLIHSNY